VYAKGDQDRARYRLQAAAIPPYLSLYTKSLEKKVSDILFWTLFSRDSACLMFLAGS